MKKLDTRLETTASMIRRGTTLLDIGTDHAYLPVYCLQNGICTGAVASDINIGPLNNAKKAIAAAGLEDKIETVLSAGFENIKENCADEIVIAGMGGILISEILEGVEWLKITDIHLIVQPMTHGEYVRRFFAENGFEILEEKSCSDDKHVYCVISAVWTGKEQSHEKGWIYYGKLPENTDADSVNFLKKTYKSLKTKYDALKNKEENLPEVEALAVILADFETNTKVNYNDC